MYDLKDTSFGDVLIAYMNTAMNVDLKNRLTDIISMLYRLDNTIYELEDKLTDLMYSENISTDDIVDMFTDLVMLRSIDVVSNNGIVLGDDLNLNIVNNVLYTIDYLIAVEPAYLEFIIKINSNDELSNIDKFSQIVSVVTDSTYEEIMHCIDDINVNLLDNLTRKIEIALDDNDEDIEEITMLLHGLIYGNPEFIDSVGVTMINKKIEIPEHFDDFLSVINNLDTINKNKFIINTVSLLFIARDSRVQPDLFYNNEIADNILSDATVSELDEYSKLFNKYVTKIKNNLEGYKNVNK